MFSISFAHRCHLFVTAISDGPGAFDFIQGVNSSAPRYVCCLLDSQHRSDAFMKGTFYGTLSKVATMA
jgi:hypothetical protein